MTSSALLAQKYDQGDTWKIGMRAPPNPTLGGWEDHYVNHSASTVCRPDFSAIPVGRPWGPKICVRRSNWEIEQGEARALLDPTRYNGVNRGSVNLYDPFQDIPVSRWNPAYYADRRPPWESTLIIDDYLHGVMPIKYNGDGLSPNRSPLEGRDVGHPYYQYAYDYLGAQDYITGLRTRSSINNTPRSGAEPLLGDTLIPVQGTSVACVTDKPYDVPKAFDRSQRYIKSWERKK